MLVAGSSVLILNVDLFCLMSQVALLVIELSLTNLSYFVFLNRWPTTRCARYRDVSGSSLNAFNRFSPCRLLSSLQTEFPPAHVSFPRDVK